MQGSFTPPDKGKENKPEIQERKDKVRGGLFFSLSSHATNTGFLTPVHAS